MENTRKIGYIDENEDNLQKEAEWALQYSTNELFLHYCNHIATLYALAGIDVVNYPVKRVIYYIDEPGNE